MKKEFKVCSGVEPDLFDIHRHEYVGDVVKSIPVGIDKVQNYEFRVTMPELGKMFDRSEQLAGILVNPWREMQRFRP